MKTCPHCGELIGDNVKECFKCHYNFTYERIISQEERTREREKSQKAMDNRIEQNKILEQQKEEQIKNNSLYEYKTVIVNDNTDGTADETKIQSVLSEYSRKGWRLHSIFTNEIGKCSSGAFVGFINGSINSTIDQTILIFERCIRK